MLYNYLFCFSEIDAGLDAIGKMVDNLGHVASTIKDEVQEILYARVCMYVCMYLCMYVCISVYLLTRLIGTHVIFI